MNGDSSAVATSDPKDSVEPIQALGSHQRLAAFLHHLPTVQLDINCLIPADSPRLDGMNGDHYRALAETDEPLPPILVHATTMQVIDGMHRVRAAVLRGRTSIEAKICDGAARDVFALAVQLNVTHGLALTRADRVTAARRLLESHPHWSNRMIATTTGLAPGTVIKIRKAGWASVQTEQLDAYIGQDGRARPVDSASGRARARKLLIEHPTASLRQIARDAGVAPSTVHNVRRRLRQSAESASEGDTAPADKERTSEPYSNTNNGLRPADTTDSALHAASQNVFRTLRSDPSLRFNENGRALLRWLEPCSLDDQAWDELISNLPDHCGLLIANAARQCAQTWASVASKLNESPRKT